MSRVKQDKGGKSGAQMLLHCLFITFSKDLSPGKLPESQGKKVVTTEQREMSKGMRSVPSNEKEQRTQGQDSNTNINKALESHSHLKQTSLRMKLGNIT